MNAGAEEDVFLFLRGGMNVFVSCLGGVLVGDGL